MAREGELETMTQAGLRKRLSRGEEALRRVADEAPQAGKGLPYPEVQKAREETVELARKARAEVDAVKAELAAREDASPALRKWSLKDRLRGTGYNPHTAAAEANLRREEREAEQAAHHAMLKRERDAKNAAEHERKRAAGMLYEPVGPRPDASDECAALFSSASLWELTENKVRDDGLSGAIIGGSDIVHAWWLSNAISEGGGQASIPRDRAPRWPKGDPSVPSQNVPFSPASIAHLVLLGLFEKRDEANATVYTFGPRTKALVASFREHWTAL